MSANQKGKHNAVAGGWNANLRGRHPEAVAIAGANALLPSGRVGTEVDLRGLGPAYDSLVMTL
jgi:hypothetical protein